MIVGTAGHIDHGKTTLVRALTGVDTDRLKEEKARGISIELGYAYAPLANGTVLGIIDVPGHERLIHTMTAGASGIDYALLVVAADDGVMPQTLEHLAILQLLGVRAGAVALTKGDRVDAARREAVRAELAELLPRYGIDAAPCFETNATRSDDPGVAALRAALERAAGVVRRRRDDGLFRLAVDRVFSLPGLGTVATGTVVAGQVEVGETVGVLVDENGAARLHEVRVRSLHVQNRAAQRGRAGERCALNLAGIDKSELGRGDWILDRRLSDASPRLDVSLTLLADADLTLKHWAPVHVHLGTLHALAHVVLLESETLAPGASGLAQLVFERAVAAVPGDRIVLRNPQATRTVGGARVLDPFGPARKRRTPERHAWLAALQQSLDGGALDAVLDQAPLGLSQRRLGHLTGMPPERLALPAGAVLLTPRGAEDAVQVFAARPWAALRTRVLGALEDYHRRLPDEQGVDAARLRRMAAPQLDAPLWRALVETLVAQGGVAQSGAWLHLPSHAVSFDANEEKRAALLIGPIAAGRFDPPWVRDLARTSGIDEENVRQVLRKMARRGDVFQIVRDLFYERAVVADLADIVARLCRVADAEAGRPSGLNAAAFRDATGLGRKRAIQVLEFFDRVGYTRFQRDRHLLRTDTRWQAGSSSA